MRLPHRRKKVVAYRANAKRDIAASVEKGEERKRETPLNQAAKATARSEGKKRGDWW